MYKITMSVDISNLPILDITGGVDPKNSNWRTDNELYLIMCGRYDSMTKFMNLIGISKLSTHLIYKDIEFRVLIHLAECNNDIPTPTSE